MCVFFFDGINRAVVNGRTGTDFIYICPPLAPWGSSVPLMSISSLRDGLIRIRVCVCVRIDEEMLMVRTDTARLGGADHRFDLVCLYLTVRDSR